MKQRNIILDTDSYKLSHWKQYPEGTEKVFSYIESRGSNFNASVDKTLFYGIQGFIKEFLTQPVKQEDIHEARWYFSQHGVPWNEEGWQTIVDEFDGYLPLEVRSVREGTRVPFKMPLVTVENTDERFYWLPTYVETSILRAIWYATTVATISRDIKDVILKYHEKTSCEDAAGVDFKLHDFGCRGASSLETAGIGGSAHLINFMGTDTVPALRWIREVYGDENVAGFSIPASEHSTMTTWGQEGEEDAMSNMIQQFGGPNSLLACVVDSYDIWNLLEKMVSNGRLHKQLNSHGGTLVVRPDSGDPVEVTVKVIETLMENFDYQTNEKGYKVLPPYLRVIQGDGVNRESIEAILENMEKHNLSVDNIAFGMGGGLLQGMDRDTFKFAMKCSAVKINGEWKPVFKDPVTDPGKKSKAGRLTLKKTSTGQFYTADNLTGVQAGIPAMETAYIDGKTWKKDSFSEVRERAAGN